MEGLVDICKTRLQINCLLRIIEACLGREIHVEEQSRNRYLKCVWSEMLMYVGTWGLRQLSVLKHRNENKHAGVSEMIGTCYNWEKWYMVLLCELVLGTFWTRMNWPNVAAHIWPCAMLCGCVAVFTGSGDACARAFNSKSGVLQKIFRGHKFIINCIQVRKGFLRWDFSLLIAPSFVLWELVWLAVLCVLGWMLF